MSKCHLALIVVAGCGGSNPIDAPDAAIDPPDAPLASRTVTGTVVDRHVTLDGEAAAPVDLSTFPIAAFVPPAFDRIFQGTGAADGTFTIPDVPEGTYYLQFGFTRFVTDRSAI